MVILQDECNIIIPSEYNKLVDIGMNSFTMKNVSGDHVTFLWKRLIQRHIIQKDIEQVKEGSILIKNRLEKIDKWYYKAILELKPSKSITQKEMKTENNEEIPLIEWEEDKGPRKLRIPENCRILLPTEFNNLQTKGAWGFEMTHYRSPVNSVKFFWEVPTFEIHTFTSANEGFLITPTQKYRTKKIGRRINKGIDINVSLHYDSSLSNSFTKIKRVLTFEPKRKK